jgi:hypothetical protein
MSECYNYKLQQAMKSASYHGISRSALKPYLDVLNQPGYPQEFDAYESAAGLIALNEKKLGNVAAPTSAQREEVRACAMAILELNQAPETQENYKYGLDGRRTTPLPQCAPRSR